MRSGVTAFLLYRDSEGDIEGAKSDGRGEEGNFIFIFPGYKEPSVPAESSLSEKSRRNSPGGELRRIPIDLLAEGQNSVPHRTIPARLSSPHKHGELPEGSEVGVLLHGGQDLKNISQRNHRRKEGLPNRPSENGPSERIFARIRASALESRFRSPSNPGGRRLRRKRRCPFQCRGPDLFDVLEGLRIRPVRFPIRPGAGDHADARCREIFYPYS